MNGEALVVGDLMRMSVQLVDQAKANPADDTVLVRVKSIDRQPDGTVMLWMENASDDETIRDIGAWRTRH